MSNLSFSKHISDIVGRAKQRCNIMFRCFIIKDTAVLIKAFNSYVRPILEYCSQVWSPTNISDIELLESVQRNFTKRLPGLKLVCYAECLSILRLCTLEEGRIILDLMFCFNCLLGHNSINPSSIGLCVSSSNTRGNRFKLSILHSDVTSRSNFLANRIASVWNSLPDSIFDSQCPLTFRRKLGSLVLSHFIKQIF